MSHSFLPSISPAIFERYPSYRALSVTVRNFTPASSAPVPAPAIAPWFDAHVDAWHAAFKSFGSNPKKFAPSSDALAKRFRKDGALPVISTVVDCYNELSLRFGAPFGGEDLDRYVGSPRLTFADGTESFDTFRDGQPHIEHPDPGEVIWRDDAGVTCRRWNWRQCKRTALREDSRNLWFVIDRLEPMPESELVAAGQALIAAMLRLDPKAECEWILLAT